MVDWNGANGFEVCEIDNVDNMLIVNLQGLKCTCRKFDLIGIPCCHELCIIMDKRLNLEEYVLKWYRKEYFEKGYN